MMDYSVRATTLSGTLSPLHKLMAASAVFLAITLILIINFFTTIMDRSPTSTVEGKAFYLVPLALAFYYVCVWFVVARQRPERKTIVVQYAPPNNITPAEARYLYTQSCDGRTYVACVVDLAARGLISIEPTPDCVYLRSDVNPPDSERSVASALPHDVPEEERLVFADLFRQEKIAVLKPPRQELLNYISLILRKRMLAMYDNFRASALVLGLAVTSITGVWLAWTQGLLISITGEFDFEMAALLGACLFAAGMASFYFWQHNRRAMLLAWRGIYRRRTLAPLLAALFFMPGVFWFSMHIIAPVFADVTVFMLLVNTFAPPFLFGYTEQGNRVMRHLLGFRRYLESAEQDRLNRLGPLGEGNKTISPSLAYATALDIRESWGDRLGAEAMIETALDRVL
jgi:hypothetical protein